MPRTFTKSEISSRCAKALRARGSAPTSKWAKKTYYQGRPGTGRDSILLRLISRSAKTLRALNNAPETFAVENATEVLLAPGKIRRRLEIRKNRVKFCLLSSSDRKRIFPRYSCAAWRPAIAAESLALFSIKYFTAPAVS